MSVSLLKTLPRGICFAQQTRALSSTTCAFSAAVDKSGYNRRKNLTKQSKGSFATVFSQTPYAHMGPSAKGLLTRGRVVGVQRNVVKLDLGGKFFAYCAIPDHQPPDKVKPGMEVSVELGSLDYTRHITGDAKPIAAYEANVHWKSLHTKQDSFKRKQTLIMGGGKALKL
eukprot:CFRG4055T1